jgi:hypothetical protein
MQTPDGNSNSAPERSVLIQSVEYPRQPLEACATYTDHRQSAADQVAPPAVCAEQSGQNETGTGGTLWQRHY